MQKTPAQKTARITETKKDKQKRRKPACDKGLALLSKAAADLFCRRRIPFIHTLMVISYFHLFGFLPSYL